MRAAYTNQESGWIHHIAPVVSLSMKGNCNTATDTSQVKCTADKNDYNVMKEDPLEISLQ